MEIRRLGTKVFKPTTHTVVFRTQREQFPEPIS